MEVRSNENLHDDSSHWLVLVGRGAGPCLVRRFPTISVASYQKEKVVG